jgi:ATP adenylyltransferase
MATRSRKQALRYRKRLKNRPASTCDFCTLTSQDNTEIIASTKSFKIIRNIFPYSHWDQQEVSDHIMIIPKKHTETILDFTASEAVEYVGLLGSYENQGYNVYARAPVSNIKSIPHQHTHLIKGSGKMQRVLLYVSRPYIRITY